jgi:hypothetical protein
MLLRELAKKRKVDDVTSHHTGRILDLPYS